MYLRIYPFFFRQFKMSALCNRTRIRMRKHPYTHTKAAGHFRLLSLAPILRFRHPNSLDKATTKGGSVAQGDELAIPPRLRMSSGGGGGRRGGGCVTFPLLLLRDRVFFFSSPNFPTYPSPFRKATIRYTQTESEKNRPTSYAHAHARSCNTLGSVFIPLILSLPHI